METPKKICVATGTRAEYGLLYWTMKAISDDPALDLQILVTGMHLSPEFGLTYQQIEADGFDISRKVEMLLSADTSAGISKSMGVGMIGYADAFDQLSPDLVVILGDRFEAFAMATAALNACIPIAHIHGGESTEGAVDEAMRHSISKMAYYHFTATEEYRRRVIQLGEHPDRVFNVGAPGLDNIKRLDLLSREALERDLGIEFRDKNLLITYHPETLATEAIEDQCRALFGALEKLDNTGLIFTLPNADVGGRRIVELIEQFVGKHKANASVFTSLGQLRYLSTLQYVDGVVGNSSSGIIEAPSFGIGTINIGRRQDGRLRTSSIIDCDTDQDSITQALQRLLDDGFQESIKGQSNPYGDGNASQKIVSALKQFGIPQGTSKSFYDIDIGERY